MNIYAGNLARELSEAELREAFAAFGEVTTASIIKDKFSGDSRGFGFVEMPNKAEADAAISALNGKELKGRTLTVNEARPRTDRARRPSGGGFGSGGGSGRGRGGFGGGRGRY
jgi:RNA recognition motif-containing protein